MTAATRQALIVEDDPGIRELIRLHLGLDGFVVEETGDGFVALERLRAARFDVILLDVMLPGIDGVSICRAVRSGSINTATPILMVTARDGESDTVLGLESGADDYLTKPFGVRELMARTRAITRRHERQTGAGGPGQALTAGDLALDRERRQLTLRGLSVELTRQEFDLLFLLVSRRGIVFGREALLRQVWPDDSYVTERTVDTVVSRLRRKIERDPHDPERLLTAWGVGYKFADADD